MKDSGMDLIPNDSGLPSSATTGPQSSVKRDKASAKLKKLNISYLKYLNPNVLLSLVPCFSNLVSLNLKMTLTVDQLLRSVGMKCPNLVDLNIASTAVTDRGIVQLCISEDGQRQCQKLARLIINDAFCITTAGAIIALQSLPNLREFDYENIFEAIQGVECWDEALEARLLSGAGVRLNTTDSPSPSSLQLTTLISSSENVQSEGLEAAVRLCPDAQSIILSNSWLPNEALYKLMAMENLTSISITNSEGLTIDFYDGILPLLCACGHHLQNLILANFTAVDITGLGKACPELKNLALSNVAQYESVSHPSPELFTKLQALELWSDPHADISLNMVKQLLSFSENIRNILLKGCEVISDKLLLDIWKAMADPSSRAIQLAGHRPHPARQAPQIGPQIESPTTVSLEMH
uniref:Uncharacterized protein n=1 Tax=Timema cristinae TaxID=61476 RepID=A0A7R9DC01_TIMCR|nr:unnamed protein product [Timema cristinae]